MEEATLVLSTCIAFLVPAPGLLIMPSTRLFYGSLSVFRVRFAAIEPRLKWESPLY